jgi:hypothetical protein
MRAVAAQSKQRLSPRLQRNVAWLSELRKEYPKMDKVEVESLSDEDLESVSGGLDEVTNNASTGCITNNATGGCTITPADS